MLRLPVSGLELTLRQPTGVEDLLLLETPLAAPDLALTLIAQLVQTVNHTSSDWGDLSVSDFEFLLLSLRQMQCGDWIRTDTVCRGAECGRRVDVSFQIQDYFAHHAPRRSPHVTPTETPGWFQLHHPEVTFRLPTIADQIALTHHPNPEQELRQRCIRPGDISAKVRRRVETAMSALAPVLSDDLHGYCAECGSTVKLFFDVQQFTLQELRFQAASVYEEIHLLASAYQWTEAVILALPQRRRQQYADYVRQARRAA